MSNYVEYFTTRKPGLSSIWVQSFWNKRMLKIATQYIPDLANKTILEIGVGHGLFAEACQKKQITYHGLEMNVEQAIALQHAGHKVLPATIPPIPQGEPVQVIWLSHILEHANDYREAKAMLAACHERLDATGHVVIIAPDILHWKEQFWAMDWSHGMPTSVNRVEQLLNETGFTVFKSMHHTSTVTNPFLAWLISWSFRLFLPINLLDYFCKKWNGRRYAHAFMSVLGWRQIFVIGCKES
jgi:2-polyprenyl-3-methyl-5-hydroxy-6-metoxy-1,4-benzoquinol methylase